MSSIRKGSFIPRGQLLLLLAMTGLFAVAATAKNDSEEDEANESWQIEQRVKWFEETHDLKHHADARGLRHQAIEQMVLQNQAARFSAMANAEIWTEMGPSSMNMAGWSFGRVAGRLNVITPDPNDENTVYIGAAAGGVWKTTNGGTSWTPMFDQVGTLPIGTVHLDPANSQRVWVGTGDKNGGACAGYFGQGVFLSTDGGQNWQAKNGSGLSSMPLSVVNGIAVSPLNSQIVLAGGNGVCDASGSLANGGMYRSADGGSSWTKVLSSKVEDIQFVPGTATVFATAAGVGLYKSTDGGATWASSNNGMTIGSGRMRMAIAPSNNQIMYVLMSSALYRTANGGSSWTLVNSSACEGQCTYNQALSVHPTNPDNILVGSIRFARSTNGGSTLSYLTQGWGTGQQVHQDTHVLVYSHTDGNRFWVGSDGGIWRSDDGGSNYTNMNSNLNIMQFYDVAVDKTTPTKIFGGAQDNSSSGRTTSNLWSLTFASGDGFMNAIDDSNSNTVLQTSYPSGSFPSIYRSTTGGNKGSFSYLNTTGLTSSGNFPWVTPLATAGTMVWTASDKLYYGTTSASSFRWNALAGSMGTAASVITPIQVGADYQAYVGTSGGKIYYAATAATTASALTDVTGNYPGGRVSDVAIDPSNTQRVFITRAGFGLKQLYRSVSGGTTWTGVGAGLPNVPANAVSIDPLNSSRIFVGTDIGVFQSTDGGDTFLAFSTGLPLGIVVSDLEINSVPHSLVAGTYSRGAWSVTLSDGATNQPPVAQFIRTINHLTISLTDQSTDSDGTIVKRVWRFGDGTTSTETNPVKTYSAAGTYKVRLTVTDDGGATAFKVKTFTVSP